MGINGTQWKTMGINGNQWGLMGLNGNQWKPMGPNGTQWHPMELNGDKGPLGGPVGGSPPPPKLTTMVANCTKAKPRLSCVCLSLMTRTLAAERAANGAKAAKMDSRLL